MKHWKFMDYWTDETSSRNLIREWISAENEFVQAEFINVINLLAVQKNWDKLEEARPLKRQHTDLGLWEIRFIDTINKPRSGPFWRYRPVGFRHAQDQFVLLRGCKKWMERYEPLECFDLAADLKRKFDQGRGTIREHEF